jgi:hypothetical protein
VFDCNTETDGACALIVTSSERARDLRRRPVIIHGGALAGGSHHIRLSWAVRSSSAGGQVST